MKSVEDVADAGLKADFETASADSGAGSNKRLSTDDESVAEKPKKQFKRRNVALYSALGTDDP